MKSLEEYKTEINKLAQNNIKGGLSSAAKLLKSDLENKKIGKFGFSVEKKKRKQLS